MQRQSLKEVVLQMKNDMYKKRIEELQTQIEELSNDNYEIEVDLGGMIYRTDIKHLETLMMKLKKIGEELA